MEAIYLHPETILANPEAFFSSDIPSLLIATNHADTERWVRQIKKIDHLPLQEREERISYTFIREVLAGAETFCKIAGPHILSYLPQWAETDTIFYLTAFDSNVAGETLREGIIMGISHPHFIYAEKLFDQGNPSIYNSMVHELFHHRYWDSWLWQVENPHENAALRELIRSLQNEGMAVNATKRIREYYPPRLDLDYQLHQFQPYVRYWFRRMNRILEKAESKSTEELYQDLFRLPEHGKYVVGGYMASRIEDLLGREALVATVEIGPMAFIRVYNSIAEEDMELNFVEPDLVAEPTYQDLRSAAREGDIPRVRVILEDIRSGQTPLLDFEVEGHLLYTTGYILLRKGHLDLAEEVFQLLIAFDPQVAAGYVGLGDVNVHKGEISAAITNYERVMELDDRHRWVAVVIAKLKQ